MILILGEQLNESINAGDEQTHKCHNLTERVSCNEKVV